MTPEKALHLFFERSPDPMAILDSKGKIIAVNSSLCKVFGSSPEKLNGRQASTLVRRNGAEKLQAILRNASRSLRSLHINLEGKKAHGLLELQVTPLQDRKKETGFLLVLAPSGETGNAKRNDAHFPHKAIEKAPHPIFYVDERDGIIFHNKACLRVTGCSASEMKNKKFSSFLPSADRKKFVAGVERMLMFDSDFTLTTSLRTAKGERRPIRLNCKTIYSAPGMRSIVIMGQGINARSNVEHELRKSDQRLREAQQIARIGNWEWNIVTNALFWSDEIFRIFGQRKGRFKASYPAFLSVVHPEDRPFVEEKVQRALDKQEKYNVVHRIVLPDQTIKYVREIGHAFFNSAGKPVRMVGTVQDITEQVVLENNYLLAHEQLRFVLSNIDEIIYTVFFRNENFQNGNIHFVSNATGRLLGLQEQEITANPEKWLRAIHPDDLESYHAATRRLIVNRSAETRRFRMLNKIDKRYKWLEDRITPLVDKDKNVIGYNGSAHDVSERMHYENELLKSKLTYKSLFENALVGIFRTDSVTQRSVAVNEICSQLFGYPDRETFLSDFVASERWADPLEREKYMKLLYEKGTVSDAVIKFRRADGKFFWGQLSAKVIAGTDQIEGVVVDVTDRMNYERELKKSIQEKDLLLKEIHHRVKNNLQVISGLLQLQISQYDDPNVKTPLQESMERIRSISMVHERLYQGSEFAEIDFSEYLCDLANSILRFQQPKINATCTGDLVHLDIAKAIPLGLIFNELISNSLKHGFNGRETGSIRIEIESLEKKVQITMRENGNGFDTEKLQQDEGLGWKLVNALVRQISGTVQVNSIAGEGTTIIVTIPGNE